MYRHMLQSYFKTIFNSKFYNQQLRLLSTCKYNLKSYDSAYEGKTMINILNREADIGLMINGVSQAGFRLNNEVTILGPMAIFPRSVLSWNVETLNDINPETLSLFTILEPKLEIIVIGIGAKMNDRSFYFKLLPFMRKYKLNFEILPTEQACTTFNFLNSEGRYVAGALIPPEVLDFTDNDLLQTKLRYENLYEIEYDK